MTAVRRVSVLVCCVALALVGCGRPATGTEALIEEKCSDCHEPDRRASGLDRAGWEETIRRMEAKGGLTLTDAERTEIIDYLAAGN